MGEGIRGDRDLMSCRVYQLPHGVLLDVPRSPLQSSSLG